MGLFLMGLVPDGLAGHVGRQLLDRDGLPGIEEVVDLPEGVLALGRRRRRRRRRLVIAGRGVRGRDRVGVVTHAAAAAAVVLGVVDVVVLEQVFVGAGLLRGRGLWFVGSPGLGDPLLELVEDADGSVLTDPVAHLQRVDPHGQLGGENTVDEVGGEAARLAGLADDGVHPAVDADAAVA